MRSFLKIGFFPAGVILCTLFVLSSLTFAGTYSGGSGTAEDPYKISTVTDWQELIATSADWDKYFVLTNDIDFGGVSISPIGDDTTKFSGVFDGNGHTISGFTHDCSRWDDEVGICFDPGAAGLFGNNRGTLLNLGVVDCHITGGYTVGCLAGNNEGIIQTCYVTGSVSGTAGVGGLVGVNGGIIINCYSKVNASGQFAVNGFVGLLGEDGTISNCYSIKPGTDAICGLVGDYWGQGDIQNSFWETPPSGKPDGCESGIGKTTAEMKTLATFTEAGWDFVYSDGNAPVWKMPVNDYPKLFWEYRYSGGSGTAENPYEISTVVDWQELIATSADWDKSFVLLNDIDFKGINLTPISFSGYFEGRGHALRNAVIFLPDENDVGLFRMVSGRIQDLEVIDLSVTGQRYVGGLVGGLTGSVDSCHVTGTVIGDDYIGGLVGVNRGYITSCWYHGTVEGDYVVGGLVGENFCYFYLDSFSGAEISRCSSSGMVHGTDNTIGGLVGFNDGIIRSCFSTSTVNGDKEEVGGLVGYSVGPGEIQDSYSTGSISGQCMVGGLVGWNDWRGIDGRFYFGKIISCFSAGLVTTISSRCDSGGLVEWNYGPTGNILSCFWDVETTGCNISDGGIGKTTAEMKTLATFTEAGWDFVYSDGNPPVWKMGPDDYPALFWEFRYSGGSGTAEDPYKISTVADWQELIATSIDWDKHFVLTVDLDFEGMTITPVGIYGTPFTGVMDGADHTLSNIKIDVPEEGDVGVFGYVKDGQIKNLGVVNANITGCWEVGGLVGFSYYGTITSCYATGTVTGNDSMVGGLCGDNYGTIASCFATSTVNGSSSVGGLAGCSESGTITSCYATGSASGDENVGGLVGIISSSSLTSCYSIGSVTGNFDYGGLVGLSSDSTISGCFWDTQASGQEESDGGEGKTTEEMKSLSTFTEAGWDFSYSDGNPPVWKMGPDGYPALFWEYRYSGGSGTAENPYEISTVVDWQELIATSADWDKHFILINDIDFGGMNLTPVAPDTLQNGSPYDGIPFSGFFNGNGFSMCNATLNLPEQCYIGLFGSVSSIGEIRNLTMEYISIAGDCDVGILCGQNEGTIRNCNTSGEVSAGLCDIGGLCGSNSGEIIDCHSTSTITRNPDGEGYFGGLCGYNAGTIRDSFASGDIWITAGEFAHHYVGGLCGANSGLIGNCYATGIVDGGDSSVGLGGLCGYNSGMIRDCNATGSVLHGKTVGGLCGWNEGQSEDGILRDCYATGTVGGRGYVGGLCGYNCSLYGVGIIDSCYSTGPVLDSASWPTAVRGGLLGCNGDSFRSDGIVLDSFWDTETSGCPQSDGGIGKSTAEMKTLATFTDAGWDFVGESANGSEDVWRMCTDDIDYPRLSWEFSNNGDLDCPDGVALEDLMYLAERWLATTPAGVGAADGNGDGKADLVDLAMVGENWMK